MNEQDRHELGRIARMSANEFVTMVKDLPPRDGPFERCAIINARCGRCSEDCRFCGQSVFATSTIAGWDLIGEEEICSAAREAGEWGVARFGIVVSGRGPDDMDTRRLARLVQAVARDASLPKICLSPGICDKEALLEFKTAGLVRFHHNLETSESFFPNVCTTHTWKERMDTLVTARELGLELCCGGLFGLGESFLDRVDLAMQLAELAPESVPVNFYVPVPGNQMDGLKPLSRDEIIRTLAMLRLALPQSSIRLCGGRTLLGQGLEDAIRHLGLGALMTGNYLLTKGSSYESDRQMLDRLGVC